MQTPPWCSIPTHSGHYAAEKTSTEATEKTAKGPTDDGDAVKHIGALASGTAARAEDAPAEGERERRAAARAEELTLLQNGGVDEADLSGSEDDASDGGEAHSDYCHSEVSRYYR